MAIRTPKKKGGDTYHVLVTTDMEVPLSTVVTDYDARSGVPESTFCQDSQGLLLRKRRKRSGTTDVDATLPIGAQLDSLDATLDDRRG